MPDVYIINLKDNRGATDKNDDRKFNICKNNGIIGVGWGSDESRTQTNYKKARHALDNMSNGDYVWTKNPRTKEHFYLLEIIDDVAEDYLFNYNEYFLKEDISVALKVKKLGEFKSNNLPDGLSKHDIVARTTVERVHEETRQFLINATNDYVAKL